MQHPWVLWACQFIRATSYYPTWSRLSLPLTGLNLKALHPLAQRIRRVNWILFDVNGSHSVCWVSGDAPRISIYEPRHGSNTQVRLRLTILSLLYFFSVSTPRFYQTVANYIGISNTNNQINIKWMWSSFTLCLHDAYICMAFLNGITWLC